jgi:dCMP deaminase
MKIDSYLRIPDWHELFMRHVYLISSKSKDPSTKIGSVLVREKAIISEGYNGMPIGVDDSNSKRYKKPNKYFFWEHSERNAIFHCARHGISTNGAHLYTNGVPCADCGRAIIQAGIKRVYFHLPWENLSALKKRRKWVDSAKKTSEMFGEAGVDCVGLDFDLGVKTLMDGSLVEL